MIYGKFKKEIMQADNSYFSEYVESPVTEITIDGYDRAYRVEQNRLTVRELTFGIAAEKPLTLAMFTDSHICAAERVLSAFYNTVSTAKKALGKPKAFNILI